MKTLAAPVCAAGLALAAAPGLRRGRRRAARTWPAPSPRPSQLSAVRARAIIAPSSPPCARSDWAGAAGRLDGMRAGAAARSRPGDALHHAGLAAGRARAADASCSPARPICRRPTTSPASPARAAPRACPICPTRSGSTASPASRAAPARAPIRGDAVADALEPLIQPADPRRPAGRGRGAARHPHRRAVRRGAHRLPAAHRLGLLSSTATTPTRAGSPTSARSGPTEYAIHAEWVAGLAAWRMGDYAAAADAFRHRRQRARPTSSWPPPAIIGRRAPTPPAAIPSASRRGCSAAARLGETFYGLLAQSALGMRQRAGRHDHLHRERLARAVAACATSAPRSRSPRSARTSSPPT